MVLHEIVLASGHEIVRGRIVDLLGELVGASSRAATPWQRSPPTSSACRASTILIGVIQRVDCPQGPLLCHSLLMQPLMHVIRLDVRPRPASFRAPIPFLFNNLVRSQADLWLLEHFLLLVHRLPVPLQLLVEASVPVEISLRIRINEILGAHPDAHVVPHVKVLEGRGHGARLIVERVHGLALLALQGHGHVVVHHVIGVQEVIRLVDVGVGLVHLTG